MNGDQSREEDVPENLVGTDVPPASRAFGEVVSRRPWYLVLLVFPFGILLAVAPFLFHLERNDLPRVLAAYDAACQGPTPGIRCVDRRAYLPRIESVDGPPGSPETFRLVLSPRSGSSAEEERWLVIREGDAWRVRDDPPTR